METLSTRDLRALFQLEGELGELAVESPLSALGHAANALARLLGDAVVWWSVMRAPLVPVASRVFGLDDSSLRKWEAGYLLEGEYAEHPMWPGLLQAKSPQTVTRRREELVTDKHWYRSAHIAEWCRGLGYDDVLASVSPLAQTQREDSSFGFMALVRPWGSRRFSPRDATMLDVVQRRSRWLHKRAVLDDRRARLAQRVRLLAPHLQRVHHHLLSGLGEKEIAAALGLSPRTVHKYVERIYEAFEVQSRPQLMALWVVTGPA